MLPDGVRQPLNRKIQVLHPIVGNFKKQGKCIADTPPLAALRRHFEGQFQELPTEHKRLRAPSHYEVEISEELTGLQARVLGKLRAQGNIL